MMPFDFEQARSYAIQRLDRELPNQLIYHSLWHTEQDVAVAVSRLAEMEGIQGHALTLLLTGAYFHDIGFVEQVIDHETASIRIALAVLPQFGYSAQDIEVVEGLINTTRIPQKPRTHLEEIVADADLDCLGREDFWTRSQALYQEIILLNGPVSSAEWCQIQLKFLQSHRYFTRSAISLRQAFKEQYISEMIRRANNGCTCS